MREGQYTKGGGGPPFPRITSVSQEARLAFSQGTFVRRHYRQKWWVPDLSPPPRPFRVLLWVSAQVTHRFPIHRRESPKCCTHREGGQRINPQSVTLKPFGLGRVAVGHSTQ